MLLEATMPSTAESANEAESADFVTVFGAGTLPPAANPGMLGSSFSTSSAARECP
jgi:hypothetical protein